jgi:carbon dioxide concentrating mechanism protein CcmM
VGAHTRRIALSLLCFGLALLAGCGDDDEDNGGLTAVEPDRAVYGSSYFSPLVELEGDVLVGEEGTFVTANTRFLAGPGQTIEIGNETNIQDNVGVSALDDFAGIRDETSVAHHALVENSEIGDRVFLGFLSEVRNSRVEDGATILHGATVEGVTIPANALVGVGEAVTSQADADALPETDRATAEFKQEVLDVNAEFAEGYIELYEEEGEDAVTSIGPNPVTPFNPDAVEPEIEQGRLGKLVRVVGDVRLGTGAEIGDRSAIRADEGTPITIGANATIGARVTFHALAETTLRVGDGLDVGDDAVIHGPLEVGDEVGVGDGAVVFRAIVGDGVQIGDGAVIAGPAGDKPTLEIPPGTVIRDGAVIAASKDLQGVPD